MNSLFGKGKTLFTSNVANVQEEIGQVTGRLEGNIQGQIPQQLGQVQSQMQDKLQSQVGLVQNTVQDRVKSQVGLVQNTVQDKLQSQVGHVQNTVQDKLQSQVGRVQNTVQDRVQSQVGPVQNTVQDKLQSRVGHVQNTVQDKLQSQVGLVQNTVQDKLQSQVGRVQNTVQDKPKSQVGRVQNTVQERVQSQLGRVQNNVQDRIKGQVGPVRNSVQDKLQNQVGRVHNNVQEKFQSQVGRVQNNVQDKLQSQVGRVQNDVQDKLQSQVGCVQNDVQSQLKHVQSQTQDRLQSQVKHVKSQAQDKLQSQVKHVQSQAQDKLQSQVKHVQSQAQDRVQSQVGLLQSQAQNKLQSQVGLVQNTVQDKVQSQVGLLQSPVQDKLKSQVGFLQTQAQDKLQKQVGSLHNKVQDKLQSQVGDFKARGLGLLSIKTDVPKSTALTENTVPTANVNNGKSENKTALFGIPTLGKFSDGPTQVIGNIEAKFGDFKTMTTESMQSSNVPEKEASTANMTNGGSQNLTSMNGLPTVAAFTDGPTQATGNFGAKFGDFKARGQGLLSMKTDAPQPTAVTKSETQTVNESNVESQNATVVNGQTIGAFTNGPTESLKSIEAKAGELKAKGLGFLSKGQDVENQSPGLPNREGNTATNRAAGFIGMFAGYGNKKGDGNTNRTDSYSTGTDSDGTRPFSVNYADTRVASCIHTYGAIVRLLLFATTTLITVRTVTVTHNHLIWGAAPFCGIFLALEFALVVFKRLGVEWTWWLPCLLIFLVTSLPMIWQLQLNGIVNSDGMPRKTDVWTIAASDAAVYLTIISRWFLKGGSVTLLTLAAVLVEFLANASDIMDLLSMTDQEVVRSNTGLMYWVLTAWSLSFIKFLPLLDDVIVNAEDSNKEGDKNVKTLPLWIQKAFGPKFPELFQILISLLLLDGSFLTLRLYLVIAEEVVTFGLVFFIIKNIVTFVLQVYRLITMYRTVPSKELETEGSK